MEMRWGVRITVVAVLAAGTLALVASCGNRSGQPASNVPDSATVAAAASGVGAKAFLAYCAMCHGPSGAGDGPLAADIEKQAGVRVANLTDQTRISGLGRSGVRRAVMDGGAHTGRSNLMPAWGERLGAHLVDQIVDYVMTLPSQSPGIPPETIQKYLAAPPGTPADGRRLFVLYCSGCHGPEGKGNGFNADTLRVRHNVRPRDLTDTAYFKDKTDRVLYATIALGGGHMGKSVFMPAWTYTLNPDQIRDLVSYVRVLSHTASKP